MKYLVTVTRIDHGEFTAYFKTKSDALDCVYLLFSVLDFPNRYTNSNFLERQLKERNCMRAGVESNMRDWSVSIEKVKQ